MCLKEGEVGEMVIQVVMEMTVALEESSDVGGRNINFCGANDDEGKAMGFQRFKRRVSGCLSSQN